ncbi:MAG: hypothetical protein M9894_18115 [Planctomycetes bacterium]|nr:hypothetical protein [Planctomycetota bacterium]
MEHPARVHVGDRPGQVAHERGRLARRQAAARGQPGVEVAAGDQVHDVVEVPLRLAERVHLGDARVLVDRRHGLGLAAEALAQVRPRVERERLEGVARAGGRVLHEVDLPHAALADRVEHAVVVEARARGGRDHGRGRAAPAVEREARHLVGHEVPPGDEQVGERVARPVAAGARALEEPAEEVEGQAPRRVQAAREGRVLGPPARVVLEPVVDPTLEPAGELARAEQAARHEEVAQRQPARAVPARLAQEALEGLERQAARGVEAPRQGGVLRGGPLWVERIHSS